jgi:glycosyltransferase involved in cell wall biosynthesis
MSTATWSIIIPALNEQNRIGQCLDSICGLDYNHDDVEVIVVDNGSTDETVSIARSYVEKIAIRVFVMPRVTVAALRNGGAEASTAPLLAFLDSDCMTTPDWLSNATALMHEHEDSVLGASYGIPKNAGWPAQLWYKYFNKFRRGEVNYVPSSNLLIRRTLFRQIGGFNGNLGSNEDAQICAKARALGHRVLAFPELAITHLGAEQTLSDFARRQYWHGSSVLNRASLKSNVRAIAIAVYTLAALVCGVAAAIYGRGLGWALLALLAPPVFLLLRTTNRSLTLSDAPYVFVLLFVYAIARALALPKAIITGIRLFRADIGRS